MIEGVWVAFNAWFQSVESCIALKCVLSVSKTSLSKKSDHSMRVLFAVLTAKRAVNQLDIG